MALARQPMRTQVCKCSSLRDGCGSLGESLPATRRPAIATAPRHGIEPPTNYSTEYSKCAADEAQTGSVMVTRLDVPDAVIAGVKAAQWPGIVLPRKRIGGSLLYPVVTINEQAWCDRIAQECGPEYELSTLHLWESWTSDLGPMPPAPAVSIVGFVSDGRPHDARRALGVTCSLGAGMIVRPGERRPSNMTRFECDVAGLALVWAPPCGAAELLVRGRGGSVATARRSHISRYFEELLFGWTVISLEVHVEWVWKQPTL